MTYTQIWDGMLGQVSETMILRDEDQAFIPFDPDNVDYQEYWAWLQEGNEPNPCTPPAPPDQPDLPSFEEAYAQVQDIDQRLSALESDLGR